MDYQEQDLDLKVKATNTNRFSDLLKSPMIYCILDSQKINLITI
jgi:hypothetical protein